MRRLVALALAGVLGPSAATFAQSPAPTFPQSPGMRVEMPEHGLAISLPSGWLHAEASMVPDEWWDPVNGTPETQGQAFLELGGVLIARNAIGAPTADEYCKVELWSAGFAQGYVNQIPRDPRVVASESFRLIDLPGGRAVVYDTQHRNGWDWRDYLVTDGQRWVALVCGSPMAPEDRWLSIAESLEFLPAEE
jgi:hypothetical protein